MKPATPPAGFVLRPLNAADAAAFLQLRLYSLQESPTAFGSSYEESKHSTAEEQVKRICFAPGQGVIIGAFKDGQLVGLGGLSRCERLKERHKAWIWGLYVLPEFRGRGLARAVMAQLMDYARAQEDILIVNLTVITSNQWAKKIYEQLGFVTTGHENKALQVGGVFYAWDHMNYEIPRPARAG
jgi:RimJ/RimL family protein N-acetyltransferase